jgi:ribosomal protein S18 acetylase RimI-like enzyme
MEFIKLDMKDESMMMAFLPLYQLYEAEISKLELEDIFPADKFDDNYEYFKEYFEGKTTYICVINGEYKGFVSLHLVCEDMPGYADGYEGWGTVSEIYTDKQLRRQGMGKVMVNKAEEELKKHVIKGIFLVDIANNELFWKSRNYTNTGIFVPDESGWIYEKYV